MNTELEILSGINRDLDNLDASIKKKIAEIQNKHMKFQLGLVHDNVLEAIESNWKAYLELEEYIEKYE
mgnify:CR=1 FL=1